MKQTVSQTQPGKIIAPANEGNCDGPICDTPIAESVDWKECPEFLLGIFSNITNNVTCEGPPAFPQFPAINYYNGQITCLWNVETQEWDEVCLLNWSS